MKQKSLFYSTQHKLVKTVPSVTVSKQET